MAENTTAPDRRYIIIDRPYFTSGDVRTYLGEEGSGVSRAKAPRVGDLVVLSEDQALDFEGKPAVDEEGDIEVDFGSETYLDISLSCLVSVTALLRAYRATLDVEDKAEAAPEAGLMDWERELLRGSHGVTLRTDSIKPVVLADLLAESGNADRKTVEAMVALAVLRSAQAV